jgi:hypothetical protein
LQLFFKNKKIKNKFFLKKKNCHLSSHKRVGGLEKKNKKTKNQEKNKEEIIVN